jgi:redox-sensitive bicupin YhaK (pirin superfamily)
MSSIILHPAQERGAVDFGWLKSFHSFNFGQFFHPERLGFGALRVINDDWVAPGKGFETHSHRNMEIVSIPLSGQLYHKDSMGNEGAIHAGDVQRMSAGTGVSHSEFNPSPVDQVSFLQIWIEPSQREIAPEYEQKSFDLSTEGLHQLVSPDGRHHSLKIHQNAAISLIKAHKAQVLPYKPMLNPDQANATSRMGCYFFVLKGSGLLRTDKFKQAFSQRDGMAAVKGDIYNFEFYEAGEILILEVPVPS